jgi:hypothetical protein
MNYNRQRRLSYVSSYSTIKESLVKKVVTHEQTPSLPGYAYFALNFAPFSPWRCLRSRSSSVRCLRKPCASNLVISDNHIVFLQTCYCITCPTSANLQPLSVFGVVPVAIGATTERAGFNIRHSMLCYICQALLQSRWTERCRIYRGCGGVESASDY